MNRIKTLFLLVILSSFSISSDAQFSEIADIANTAETFGSISTAVSVDGNMYYGSSEKFNPTSNIAIRKTTKDIYQRIWDADQNENGIQAILDTQQGDQQRGYVKVNTKLTDNEIDKELRVLTDLHLPEDKQLTYRLGLKLFDNYALSESDEELDSEEERTEVHDFINTIIDTAPMQIAREYVAAQTGTSITREEWYNTITEMWFSKFKQSGDPSLSGFEHVIVGEQENSKVQGYHFWYKYYLDDGFARELDGNYAFPALSNDRIHYHGSKHTSNQEQFPESVTISYKWFAPDYERQGLRPLFKKIGGFFVGCSLEGLLALGTVRAYAGADAPKRTIINGAEYELALFHSMNGRHIRTFYPKFIRAVENTEQPVIEEPIVVTPPTSAVPSSIRIIAALVNPEGDDVGLETVTLINTGPSAVDINNWQIIDKNNNSYTFFIGTLPPNETHRLTLDGKTAQLSNKGGSIKLLNQKGEMVHLVSYSGPQVREQGKTIIFL